MVRANALNSVAQTIVYVNPSTGSDTAGNGSFANPYATITKANSVITDNTTAKRYCVHLTGQTSEAAIVIKPFVSYVGDSFSTSQITVSGAGNNVTLDASWNGTTAGVTFIKSIGLKTSNISFSLTGDSGTAATIYLEDILVNGGTISATGRATLADFIQLDDCEATGNITYTDIAVSSTETAYDSNMTFRTTNSTIGCTMVSQGDYYTGNITCSETSGLSTALQVLDSFVLGSATVTGATASLQYDAVSYPQGGITLTTSGMATQYISSPGVVPHTSVTGATYTLLGYDYYLACNRAGAIALTFPTATGSGRVIVVKDVSGAAAANNITATSSGATYDGVATLTINTNYGSVTCTDTATNVWSLS